MRDSDLCTCTDWIGNSDDEGDEWSVNDAEEDGRSVDGVGELGEDGRRSVDGAGGLGRRSADGAGGLGEDEDGLGRENSSHIVVVFFHVPECCICSHHLLLHHLYWYHLDIQLAHATWTGGEWNCY